MSIPNNTTPIELIEKNDIIQEKLSAIISEETEETEATETPNQAVSPMKVTTDKLTAAEKAAAEAVAAAAEEAAKNKEKEEKEKEEINEKTNPTIEIYVGKKLDVDSIVVHFTIIGIWIAIWYKTGLINAIGRDPIFTITFGLFILYNLISITTAGISSGGAVYELNILLTVEQMVSILFGTIVLFTLFHKNLNIVDVTDVCKKIINKLCIINIIILTMSSLWVSVWTSGRAFRFVRKFKQGIYNISLSIFIIIGFIYIKSINGNGGDKSNLCNF